MKPSRFLIPFLVISLVVNVCLAFLLIGGRARAATARLDDNRKQFETLKESYLQLSGEHQAVLEVFVTNSAQLKTYFPAYENKSQTELEEGLRQKLVQLRIEAEQLRKTK